MCLLNVRAKGGGQYGETELGEDNHILYNQSGEKAYA